MITKLAFMIFLSLNGIAQAKEFRGFKKNPAAGELSLSGFVSQFIETDSEFKILISKNAAFYTFPKDKNGNDLKKIFEQSQKKKDVLHFEINAYSREIISIKTTEK